MNKLLLAGLMGCIVLALSAIPCGAYAIDLTINGDGLVGSTTIDFSSIAGPTSGFIPPGYKAFTVTSISTSMFSSDDVDIGDTAMIQDLNAQSTAAASAGLPFLTFDSGGSDLELYTGNIAVWSAPPTPAGIAILVGYVFNTTTKTIVGGFSGTYKTTSSSGDTSSDQPASPPLITSSPVGVPVSGIAAVADPSFGADSRVTAAADAATPEPGSLVLIGAGLLVLAAAARRHLFRKS